MSSSEKNFRILKIISQIKQRELQRELLSDLTRTRPSIIYSLKRLAKRLLKGTSKLGVKEERLLLKNRRFIVYLATVNTKDSVDISQVGGFISYILPVIFKVLLDCVL